MNLLQNLHEKLKRSDKKRQIRSSGSVPGANWKRYAPGNPTSIRKTVWKVKFLLR